jgi:quercetin dioxygenase-like cupin family protein
VNFFHETQRRESGLQEWSGFNSLSARNRIHQLGSGSVKKATMKKSGAVLVLCLGLVAMFTETVLASDPDLTTDFNVSHPTAGNFTFTGFRQGNLKAPSSGIATPNFATFNTGLPGLNGLGLSAVLFQFSAYSQVSPHTHPRATEMFYLLSGQVDVGFVDTSNNLFETSLYAGDIFIFPKGLLHFQRNNQDAPALGYSALSSENPGVLMAASALFTASGTGLPDNVLETALGTNQNTVEAIKKKLSGSSSGY